MSEQPPEVGAPSTDLAPPASWSWVSNKETADVMTRWLAGSVFAFLPLVLSTLASGWYPSQREQYLVASAIAWQALVEQSFVAYEGRRVGLLILGRLVLLANIVLAVVTAALFALAPTETAAVGGEVADKPTLIVGLFGACMMFSLGVAVLVAYRRSNP